MCLVPRSAAPEARWSASSFELLCLSSVRVRQRAAFGDIGQESDVLAPSPSMEIIGHFPDLTACPRGAVTAEATWTNRPPARLWVGSAPRCAMIEGMGDAAGTARGLLVGAVLGGLGWGLLAANTVGGRGDQGHLRAVAGLWLAGAVVVSLLCLGAAKVLWPAADGSRAAVRRTFAMALVTAPIGGWAFLFLQWLQYSS